MTEEQQKHMYRIILRFSRETSKGYEVGAVEHGGYLWEKDPIQLLKEAKKEFGDGYTYVDTVLEIFEKLLEDVAIQKMVIEIQQKITAGEYN